MKKVDWIQTFTGKRVCPLDVDPEDIDIRDIAHSLANQCRFGGHVREFYSVAEHSVFVSVECPARHAMTALLHDATEAYLVDVPTPVKELLPLYHEMESKLWKAIARRFDLPLEIPAEVKRVDRRIMEFEARALMNGRLDGWRLSFPKSRSIIKSLAKPYSPREAEGCFLNLFRNLGGR